MRAAQKVLLVAVNVVAAAAHHAQQPPNRNLQTCLSGKYPALCDHNQLTPDQLRDTRAAELRENLRLCLTGKYPALCNHSSLTPEQTSGVREAERVENFRVCSSGKYPTLCRYDLLAPNEVAQVRSARLAENLRVCMEGRYPTLCDRALLAPDQAKDVAAAEAKVASARLPRSPRTAQLRPRAGDCEAGHWIEAVEGDGKIIKLEDGSLWEVDDVDTVTTSIWLPVSDVLVCDGKMVNVDDGESAQVTPVAATPRPLGTAPAVRGSYVIQSSANDETFIINGEVFKAKTYCFGFDRGDRVTFLSGSAFGACVSASILHVRSGKVCKVWCE